MAIEKDMELTADAEVPDEVAAAVSSNLENIDAVTDTAEVAASAAVTDDDTAESADSEEPAVARVAEVPATVAEDAADTAVAEVPAPVAEDAADTASPAEDAGPSESQEPTGDDGSVAETPHAADDSSATAPDSATEATSDEPERPRIKSVGERPAITAPRDVGDVADDLSADDFAAAVERTVFEFKEGDIIAGVVVRVDPDEALVDIGYKSEGVIPSHELSIRNNASPSDVVSVGDEIEALVLQMEDESGRLVMSKKRAQYERAWGRIEGIMSAGEAVSGPVIEVVKGGLIVDIGLRGFLPASLVDLRRVRDLAPYVGTNIEAKVIELDKNRNNVVLSRRAYLEEAQAEQRHAFLEDLKPGDVREGVVSSVVNFGAFVDLGGMDGLVHVSELSWRHVSHPGEVVTVGDKVDVRVLEVDRERERISLSIRQTREDPWEEFSRSAAVGSIVDGKVTKTVPFGAFVSVGEGVEGLVHVSEIAIHHVDRPEMELAIGAEVKVKVTEVDAERRRVSLSIKQALPEWEERSAQWKEQRRSGSDRPRRQEFQREDEAPSEPSFNADSSLAAILAELKERGIGRS
jgi:small subunit ribosomal protein S1